MKLYRYYIQAVPARGANPLWATVAASSRKAVERRFVPWLHAGGFFSVCVLSGKPALSGKTKPRRHAIPQYILRRLCPVLEGTQ